MNQSEKLNNYIKARYPIIAVVSHEETRVISDVRRIALSNSFRLVEWKFTAGLQMYEYKVDSGKWEVFDSPQFSGSNTKDPAAAFEAMLSYPVNTTPTLFVMKDLHNILAAKRPDTIRYLRDIANYFSVSKHALILLSPTFAVPSDLEKTIAVIDWPLPDTKEIDTLLSKYEQDLPLGIPNKLNGHRDNVIQALRGLTAFEAESVLLSGVVEHNELSDTVIPTIVREKAQIIRKSGVLEFYDKTVTMQDIGGLTYLKRYAAEVRAAFSQEAEKAGVDTPKGVLLVGVPGTGKSLSAKAIAGGQMPLLRMDIGALMGGLVGQSEGNMRQALKTAEAVAPCVLWVDEIEKSLGNMGGEQDGGTSQRVFGTLLTWMQETTAPVYVVATANDVRALRPELIRRFDDIFWVDLPNQKDRLDIANLHLTKRGYDKGLLKAVDPENFASATFGFSGAEIEKVIKAAIKTAFFDHEPLTVDHLMTSASQIVPVSETMSEQIKELRKWAKTRARPAGEPLEALNEVDDYTSRQPNL